MWSNKQEEIWEEIKNTWNEQPQSEKINIQISQLLNEFKGKVSQFEKESVNSDMATLKVNWAKIKKEKISQFEKDSIKKDIDFISKFIKKMIDKFKR